MRPWSQIAHVRWLFTSVDFIHFVDRTIVKGPVPMAYAAIGMLKQVVGAVLRQPYKQERLILFPREYVARWAACMYECWYQCPEVFRQQTRTLVADLRARALIGTSSHHHRYRGMILTYDKPTSTFTMRRLSWKHGMLFHRRGPQGYGAAARFMSRARVP